MPVSKVATVLSVLANGEQGQRRYHNQFLSHNRAKHSPALPVLEWHRDKRGVLNILEVSPVSPSPPLLRVIKSLIQALELLPAGVAHVSACVTRLGAPVAALHKAETGGIIWC